MNILYGLQMGEALKLIRILRFEEGKREQKEEIK